MVAQCDQCFGHGALAFALSPLAAAERPNILWLTSEDHGPHLGCYGDPLARTPHIDALAAKGMLLLSTRSDATERSFRQVTKLATVAPCTSTVRVLAF